MAQYGAAIQGAGTLLGGVSSMFGGGGSSSAFHDNVPKWARHIIRDSAAAGNAALPTDPTQGVVGFNADQRQAFDMIRDAVGMGRGQTNASIQRVTQLARAGLTPAMIQRFMNPYVKNVVNAANRQFDYNRDMSNANIESEAEAAKAFGGDRAEVAKVLANEQNERLRGQTVADLYRTGYDTATDTAGRNIGLRLAGESQLQQLLDARRAAAMGDAGALATIGDQEQNLAQQRAMYGYNRLGMLQDLTKPALLGGGGGTQPGGTGGSSLGNFVVGMQQGGQIAGGLTALWDQIFGTSPSGVPNTSVGPR